MKHGTFGGAIDTGAKFGIQIKGKGRKRGSGLLAVQFIVRKS